MKKYYIILLTSLTMSACWGQYPQLRTDSSGKVFRVVKFKEGTEKPYAYYVKDTMFIVYNLDVDTVYIEDKGYDTYLQIYHDSAKIYYQRFNKYNKLFNDELARLNNFKKPTITQRLLDYQDSLIRYKILLNRLKK